MNRKLVGLLALLITFALGMAACQPAPVETPAEAPVAQAEATAAPAAEAIHEAPQLHEKVLAGQLPPLAERLPLAPLVIEPVERIGVYGGTWRSGLLGQADSAWIGRTMGYDPFLRWAPDLTKTIPNVAKDWEVSADGTEFTFYLREGMKWSDGQPFTADDVLYWYEAVILNDQLTPVKPQWMRPGGTLGVVEKVDDYTVRFKFGAPHGLFLKQLGSQYPFEPAHYMQQWHIDYNKEGVEKAVAELQMQDWVALYGNKRQHYNNVDYPTLNAWVATVPANSATQLVAERNPYYWKVDTEGNQLPYIDQLVYPIAESVDVLVLKALAGEIDMMDRHIATPANKAVFFDNMEDGDYHFFNVEFAWETPVSIGFNLSHKDPVLKEIFNQKDFRAALSMGINRQDIIDVIYVGDGEPRQPAPLAESPYYNEKLAYQYTEYDPAAANQMLDDLGLTRGGDGIRQRPDGTPLSFTIEVIAAFEPWADIMELVSSYWSELGIASNVKVIERSLFYERKAAYEHDVIVWTGADGIALVMDPRSYMAFSNESLFGVAWADWWASGGAKGEEPSEPARRQQALYDELQVTVDPARQDAIMTEILDIATEQFWVMGITKYYKGYGIIKNNFYNVPESVWQWHVSSAPAQTRPEQYFIQD
ncbi:MAG: ABC transporter substrate-binding protein [Caldilineaceae bacterium]|nr:ABC transporter substrate-binding protein [Caldilineaceae bacterium]